MPPYKAVVSKAQSRKLFALSSRGEIAESDARGKTRAANWKKLPKRVSSKRGLRRGR